MRTALLSLLLIFPSPPTFIAFFYLASFFYIHALLKYVTNYHDQQVRYAYLHTVPTRVTNTHYQRT